MKVAFETLSFSLRSKNQLVFSPNFWIIPAVRTSVHHICVVGESLRNKYHGWQVLTPVGFPLAHLKCFAQNLCKIGPIFLLQTPQLDCCVICISWSPIWSAWQVWVFKCLLEFLIEEYAYSHCPQSLHSGFWLTHLAFGLAFGWIRIQILVWFRFLEN